MSGGGRPAERRPGVGLPAEMPAQRGDEQRGVRDPAGDDDVRVRVERGEDFLGAEVRVGPDVGPADLRERHAFPEPRVGGEQRHDVVTDQRRDLEPGQAKLPGNGGGALGSGQRIRHAHVGDDARAVRKDQRQHGPHPARQQWVEAAGRVGLPVAVSEGQGALADAFEHQDVEGTVQCEFNGRIQPVGGEAGAAADSEVTCHGVDCRS